MVNLFFIAIFPPLTEESAVVSLSPLTYEVVESDGTVNIVLTKTGNFQRPIAGTLTTATGSAGGMSNTSTMHSIFYCGIQSLGFGSMFHSY